MSQIFDEKGRVVPVTLVKVLPNIVLGVKNKDKDGYAALQLGMGEKREKNMAKPQRVYMKDLPLARFVREFRFSGGEDIKNQRGDKIDVSIFVEGDLVKVSGISKAKGFQGVVKRYNFRGAPATHGTKHAHRQPGSLGGGGRAGGRVAKGMRMAGRMGGERVTTRNLKIVKIDADSKFIAIKGAIPGRKGTLLEIRSL